MSNDTQRDEGVTYKVPEAAKSGARHYELQFVRV